MHIFYLLYRAVITLLLAITMPESRGRWSGLYEVIVSILSYTRLTTSAIWLPYQFVTGAAPVSTDDSFSSTEGIDVCWESSFGINGTCHPLDDPITPTPTVVPDAPANRTVSAILASPIPFNPVLYKDIFIVQSKIAKVPRGPSQSESTQAKILSEAASAHLLDLLSAAVSTVIVVQFLTVLGKFVVRCPKTSNLITFIPNDLEFHPLADFPDERHPLILSWVSTTSSLIHIDPIASIRNGDRANLNDLPLWAVYFAVVLIRSCPRPAVLPPPPPIESRVPLRRQLMIEAPTSEAAGVLSCCGSQSHTIPGPSFGSDGSSEAGPLELKDKVSLPTPILGSQAQGVAHTPGLPTANSLHLEDYFDNLWSEITDPVQLKDPASPFLPETPSARTGRSHPHHSPDVSGPTLIRSFERISGRRVTPLVQLEYGQGNGAGKIRSSSSSSNATSMESMPLGSEDDLGFLSQFPAPPKKAPVRLHSLLRKAGMGGVSFLRPSPSPTPDGIWCQESRLGGHAGLTLKLKRGSSIHYKPASQRCHKEFAPDPQSDTETTSEEGSPVPNVRLPMSSTLSRWNLSTKKGKRKLRKFSSLFFASPNRFNNLHEKVDAFSKGRAFDKDKKLPGLPSPSTAIHDL